MKSIYIKCSFILIMITTFLVSCLKDKAFDTGEIQPVNGTETKVVGVVLTAQSNVNFLALAFNSSDKDTTFNLIPITLATKDPASQDLHITLAENDQAINDYNTANTTSFTPASSANYTIVNPGGVVLIPKGSNTGYLQIKLKPNNFIGVSAAFPFKITNIKETGYTISGNQNTGIVGLNIKNQYDGHYAVSGSFTDLIRPSVTGYYPFEIDLITAGANTVDFFTTTQNIGPYHPINSGGLAYYGSFRPEFTFDPASNKLVSVINTYGQPAPNGRSAAIDPAGINTFDPATKTISISYLMLQPGTSIRTKFTEVYTYIGPRS